MQRMSATRGVRPGGIDMLRLKCIFRVGPLRRLLLILFGSAAAPLGASTFCVSDVAELQSALDLAATNGSDDEIRLNIGTYAGSVSYDPSGFDDGRALTIRGGYIPFLTSCVKATEDPHATVLSDPAGFVALTIHLRPSAAGAPRVVRIEQLTFTAADMGLWIDEDGADVARQVEVRRNVFEGLAGSSAMLSANAVEISRTGSSLRLEGNLVRGNGTDGENFVAFLVTGGSANTVEILHNTIVDNVVGDSAGLFILCDLVAGPEVGIANNILWGNLASATLVLGGASDLRFEDACATDVAFNDIGSSVGIPDTGTGNVSLLPGFRGPLDYELGVSSPVRNLGDLTPPGGLPAADLLGRPRQNGSSLPNTLPDLGAFETPWIFADGWESGSSSAWSGVNP